MNVEGLLQVATICETEPEDFHMGSWSHCAIGQACKDERFAELEKVVREAKGLYVSVFHAVGEHFGMSREDATYLFGGKPRSAKEEAKLLRDYVAKKGEWTVPPMSKSVAASNAVIQEALARSRQSARGELCVPR